MSEIPSAERDAWARDPEVVAAHAALDAHEAEENRLILELGRAIRRARARVTPPAARGTNPYPNGHTHPSFVGCSEAKPPCPKHIIPPGSDGAA